MEELGKAIAAGGTFGLILALLVAIWAFATAFLRVGRIVDRDAAAEADRRGKEAVAEAQRRDKREAELIAERDEWKGLAQGSTPEIKRLGDLLQSAMDLLARRGIK